VTAADGGSRGFGDSGGSSEYGEPVFRDKRRVDPETGQVREPQTAAPSTPPPGPDASAPSTPAPSDDTAKLEAELAERTADLQRLQAEYVNYKRRVDRDRQVVKDTAVASVLTALLPVLDDIGRAREHDELTGGFKAVAESLERTVNGLGLEVFGEVGDPFDPRIHEALMHRYSDDVSEPVAQAILQVGYRLGERIVRPARVAVVEPEHPVAATPDEGPIPTTEAAASAGPDAAARGEDAASRPADPAPGEGAAPHDGGTEAGSAG
jgi:molecular chaperone GrpE